MRFTPSLFAGLLLLPHSSVVGQVPIAAPISVDSARALLGTDPVAVPSTPASIYALSDHMVLVVQQVDTGVSAAFLETRGPNTFSINWTPCPEGSERAWQDGSIGSPSCEELRMRARQRYRYIANLNVALLYDRQARAALSRPRDWQRMWPSARLIQIDGHEDLRAQDFLRDLAPMNN